MKPKRRRRKPLSDAEYLCIEQEAADHASEQKWPGTHCHKREQGTVKDAEEHR